MAAVSLATASSDARDIWRLPAAISAREWTTARATPDCIVTDLLYADVGVLVAPGGTGKTTLILVLAVCIALGRPFLELAVQRAGPVLLITGEDTREMLVARLRRIAEALGLGVPDLDILRERIVISDVSGSGFRLTAVIEDTVRPAAEVDLLAKQAARLKPALVVIDPAVSFGVGESRINDAEQGLIEAGRRLRSALNCCVLYVHHTGKENARNSRVDQYAGRGGSAFADGARMVLVLQALSASDWIKQTDLALADGEQGLILARPKISYCAAKAPLFVKRAGYAFAMVAQAAPRERHPAASIDQLLSLVTSELEAGHRHSARSLEALYGKAGMKRNAMRDAIASAFAVGKLVELNLPPAECHGKRKTYLALAAPLVGGPLNPSVAAIDPDSPASSEAA